MKKDKEQSSFVNIGSSSLLIVFVILCLATFAILSISSAKSDFTLSEKLAKHKGQYYEASSKAEEVLEEIDATLADTASKNSASTSSDDFIKSPYIDAVIKKLNDAQISDTAVSCQKTDKKLKVFYQIPLDDKQALDIELIVTDYTKNETYYTIQKWQVISTDTWESDDTLNLMPVIQ
jgi:hypothetical protein